MTRDDRVLRLGQFLGVLYPKRFASLTVASTSSRIPPEGRALWSQRVKDTREKGLACQVAVAVPRQKPSPTAGSEGRRSRAAE